MFIGQCIQYLSTSQGLMLSLLVMGVVGSFSHCAGMCSPFVLAQTSDLTHEKGVSRFMSGLLLPYHFGRMTTYILLAVILNTSINIDFISAPVREALTAHILFLAGVIFIASAFTKISSLFPWAAQIKGIVSYGFIGRMMVRLRFFSGTTKRYLTGVMLGFMPCGLVIAAVLAASTAPDTLTASFGMAAFSIGTMTALMMVGASGQILKQKFPILMDQLPRGAMLISGAGLFAVGGKMIL